MVLLQLIFSIVIMIVLDPHQLYPQLFPFFFVAFIFHRTSITVFGWTSIVLSEPRARHLGRRCRKPKMGKYSRWLMVVLSGGVKNMYIKPRMVFQFS